MGEAIFKLTKESGIGVVTFDVSGDVMNTWTEEAIASYREVLGKLEKEKELKGVIFISGKKTNFFAGANLRMIEALADVASVKAVIDVFHDSFNRLSALNLPTVAAINGVCAGGGLEFTLACTARIATDGKGTVIGLPECNVGLFPGAGGTQRLPRLIGYPAMDLILKGDLLPAAKAYEAGIVDRIVPADKNLLDEAKSLLGEIIAGKAELKRPEQEFSQIDTIANTAREGVLKATKGRELPGPLFAIKAMQEGLKLPLKDGLEIEKKYFIQTALSPEAKGSINSFFLKTMTDKPKGMMTKGFVPKPVLKVAVLGFGTMGRGIVISILQNMKIPVIVKDFPEAFEPGKDFVRKILEGMAKRGQLSAPVDDLMGLLKTTSEYGPEFKDIDLVVEAVFEEISVKEQAYKDLCPAVRDDCLIASNTSSLLVTAMSKYVPHPERYGGTHFFSPVWMMELVEIVRGDNTSQETVDSLLAFSAAIRKRPIVCRDNPGFVVNALLLPYMLGAFAFVEAGNPIEKVDAAMTKFGMPVGPIRLTDEVGIDVPYKVMVGLGIKQDTLKNVTGAGRLGLKKSGKGFFLKDGSVDPEVLPLIARKETKDVSEEEIQMELFASMVKVGKDLLDRKIVEDTSMVDVGMIWGTGFPSDKGGAMKWADLIGLSKRLFGKSFY
ncbi:MAG: 3-hydroxyacyl-CoA dehydrogenase NAD-binding domain-containing protein [Syntrophales bacterium]|nr:3-hydroxyacyl-CoA dehydrogenase NAD-binding domain-containing protein [Syntrophales bacterium]